MRRLLRFKGGELHVGGRDLEGIEHQRRRLVIDHIRRQLPYHVGQSHLDGVRVLERRQRQYPLLLEIRVNLPPSPMPAHVKVTIGVLAHRRRSALRPVDFDVLTSTNAWWIGGHFAAPLNSALSSQLSALS